VKKLITTAAAVAGGLALWRKVKRDRAEQDLWAEATDPIGSRPGGSAA
jgi:hypothetical protein